MKLISKFQKVQKLMELKYVKMESNKLHQMLYLVSLTIGSYTMVYIFATDVIFYQVKILMFYIVQTTNLT